MAAYIFSAEKIICLFFRENVTVALDANNADGDRPTMETACIRYY